MHTISDDTDLEFGQSHPPSGDAHSDGKLAQVFIPGFKHLPAPTERRVQDKPTTGQTETPDSSPADPVNCVAV